MRILFLALWLQMSAPPCSLTNVHSADYCFKPMTLVHNWGDGPLDNNSGWTTAEQSWIAPKGQCGQHADGSFTDCCGALMKFSLAHFLNQRTALDDITRDEFAQAAQRAADETDGKPPKCLFNRKSNAGSNCYCEAADKCRNYTPQEWDEFQRIMVDAVDVPAVQETREVEGGDNWCNYCSENRLCTTMACDPHHKIKETFETCADKARILEHDENSPPKYWCRKVEF